MEGTLECMKPKACIGHAVLLPRRKQGMCGIADIRVHGSRKVSPRREIDTVQNEGIGTPDTAISLK